MLKEFTEKFDFFDGGEGGRGVGRGEGVHEKPIYGGKCFKKCL